MNDTKTQKTGKHWYLVTWESDKQRGFTEVPMTQPWAAGDTLLVTAYLHRCHPQAGIVTITGTMPIAPPREPVGEAPKPEPAAQAQKLIDVWINGKLARTAVSEEAAWDMVEERHHADFYELLDSKTGISIAKG